VFALPPKKSAQKVLGSITKDANQNFPASVRQQLKNHREKNHPVRMAVKARD